MAQHPFSSQSAPQPFSVPCSTTNIRGEMSKPYGSFFGATYYLVSKVLQTYADV